MEPDVKPIHCFLLALIAVATPAAALAQNSNGQLTRAEVLQHLYDLEGIGYHPAEASSLRFPYDIEAAEARLAAKNRQQAWRASAQACQK